MDSFTSDTVFLKNPLDSIYVWDENSKTTHANKNISNTFYNLSLTKNESVYQITTFIFP